MFFQDKQLKECAIPARDKYFPGLVQFLKNADSGYLVGKKITWADIYIADHLTTIEECFPNMFDGYPKVKEFCERILEIPQLKKWIQERPKVPY